MHSVRKELMLRPLSIKTQCAAESSVRVSLRLRRNKNQELAIWLEPQKISGISLDGNNDIPLVHTLLEVLLLEPENDFQALEVGEMGTCERCRLVREDVERVGL
jgi:hypothetical protein